jgi:hypothetical protein
MEGCGAATFVGAECYSDLGDPNDVGDRTAGLDSVMPCRVFRLLRAYAALPIVVFTGVAAADPRPLPSQRMRSTRTSGRLSLATVRSGQTRRTEGGRIERLWLNDASIAVPTD